jgi:hypothetical protein
VVVLALLLETKQAALEIPRLQAHHKEIMAVILLTLLILHRQTETHTLVAAVAALVALVFLGHLQT